MRGPFPDGERLLVQCAGLLVFALCAVEVGQFSERTGDQGVFRTELVFLDVQCLLVESLGLLVGAVFFQVVGGPKE